MIEPNGSTSVALLYASGLRVPVAARGSVAACYMPASGMLLRFVRGTSFQPAIVLCEALLS